MTVESNAWLDVLICPRCRSDLTIAVPPAMKCAGCGTEFPLRDGILRFVETDQYVSSFSRQWRRYEVQQPAEDEATFRVKTGVEPATLVGLRVLDGGCGGGRYAAVAGRYAKQVAAVDLSLAVEKAAALCRELPAVTVMQADLLSLPFRNASFDFVFSLGVLHHSPDPRQAFRELAQRVRPGGRLAVWLYRRNTGVQEAINSGLRAVTTRLPAPWLETLCKAAALLGAVPILNRTLNKVVNFSNHPVRELRICDNFDWYSPKYQSHHTPRELRRWFEEEGFEQIVELPPAKTGRFYRWCYERNLIIGSGVNTMGVRRG